MVRAAGPLDILKASKFANLLRNPIDVHWCHDGQGGRGQLLFRGGYSVQSLHDEDKGSNGHSPH